MNLRQTELAGSDEWRISEFRCSAGPQDRPFEEAHDGVSISLVASGTFEYRTACGDALLYPGAYLLGNSGECFECAHRHGVGDRCIALHARQALFEEIAASVAGTSRFKFQSPCLPPLKCMAPQTAALHLLREPPGALALESGALGLIVAAIRAASGAPPASRRLSARDVRRISRVLRHMAGATAAAMDLKSLAASANMSKFHFLRTFRRVTGATPYRYILDLRLGRAALALMRSREPVVSIALNEGFDDVSTFNRYFKQAYRATPTQYRLQRGTTHVQAGL